MNAVEVVTLMVIGLGIGIVVTSATIELYQDYKEKTRDENDRTGY